MAKQKMTKEAATAFNGKSGTVETIKDRNGTDQQIVLQNTQGMTTTISLYGGQVVSWKAGNGEELLFMSNKATNKPPTPVRGGIPICFPQFGSRGLLEQHGFARNRTWTRDDEPTSPRATGSDGEASVKLVLKPSTEDLTKVWPHRFEIQLRITLSDEGHLILRSRVKNTNGKNFSFQIAYRTYFSVSDISEVRVEGLETLDYVDRLQDGKRFTEQGNALTIESEIDRVYLNSSGVVALFDHGKKRTFHIKRQGLPDIAVWNPWDKKAKALPDLGDDQYKNMLCIDGSVIDKNITLKANEEWIGQLELSVLSSC